MGRAFTGVIYREIEQGTPPWFDIKRGRFSGSRAGDLMASMKTEAFKNLIRDLAWERKYGDHGEDGPKPAGLQRGNDLEPEALDWYAFEVQQAIDRVGFIVSGSHDYFGVSPDALVGDDGMCQVKCLKHRQFMAFCVSKALEPEYDWQVHSEIWAAEREWSDFVVYHPKAGGRIVRVQRDEKKIAAFQERLVLANELVNQMVEEAA